MRRGITAAVTVVLAGASALAYQALDHNGAPARWANARCVLYHDPSWSAFAGFVGEASAALATWNVVPGSNFVFVAGGSSPSTSLRDTTNGNNDIYFDNLPASAYAVTYLSTIGTSVQDRDVAFNSNYVWSLGTGGGADFRSIAIHEFGHVLGLGHESTVPAVMRPFYDGSSFEQILYFDDAEGCRFLYPAPPPPPPPPNNADLAVSGVTFTPGDVTDGDDMRVAFTMRNAGTDPTGTFAATVYLTEGASVSPSDRFLRTALQSSLAPGEVRDVTLNVRLPDSLEARSHRVGVILDAQGAVGDRDRSNNGDVASQLILGGGDIVPVGLGYRVTGTLIPFGRESFGVDLVEGTRLSVRASIEGSSLELIVTNEATGEVVSQQQRYRRATARVKVPETARYVVRIASQSGHAADYEMRFGAKTVRINGALLLTRANQVLVPGYAGSDIVARVRSRSAAKPSAEWAALDAPQRTARRGRRVRLGRVRIPETAPLVLALSQGDGPEGEVAYKIRIRIPKRGPLIRR